MFDPWPFDLVVVVVWLAFLAGVWVGWSLVETKERYEGQKANNGEPEESAQRHYHANFNSDLSSYTEGYKAGKAAATAKTQH